MPTATPPLRPPFDDVEAAAVAVQLRAAARACDTTRAALRRDRSSVAPTWRGPAGDDVLDGAARLVADLERASAGCEQRARWVEQLVANIASATPSAQPGLSVPEGFTWAPPLPMSSTGTPTR